MNRRSAIRCYASISAGMLLLPSCLINNKPAGKETLIAELAETIIPATDTPGAKDLAAHLFVLKMVNDCASKEEQQKFFKGMEAFTAACTKTAGKPFVDCTPEQRTAFLQQLETAKDKNTDQHNFYYTTKYLTIEAYTTSKFFLTKVNVYKLVPGHFNGCVPVKTGA